MHAFVLHVATVNDVGRIKLAEQVLFLSALRHLHMCLCVVVEEEVLVLGVSLDPLLQLRVVQQLQVGLSLEIPAVMCEEHLLEVAVVEDIRVHRPAAFLALVVITGETKSVRAHQGNKFRCTQPHHVELPLHNCVLMARIGDCESIRRLTFGFDVLSAHAENHRRATAVFDSRVASKLNQVSD